MRIVDVTYIDIMSLPTAMFLCCKLAVIKKGSLLPPSAKLKYLPISNWWKWEVSVFILIR